MRGATVALPTARPRAVARRARSLAPAALAAAGLLAAAGAALHRDSEGPGRLFLSPGRAGLLDGERSRILPPESKDGEVAATQAAASEPAGASGPASAANLAKNIIGAGVLALPAGASQLVSEAQSVGVDAPTATAGIALLFCVFGALNAFGFYLVGEVCARTGARSYQSAWSKTMGKDLAWVPSAASLICCLTGTVACASVIGDTASDLITASTGLGLDAFGRDALLWGLSGSVLLPLCLLPSLAPLAFASLLGLVGVCLLAAVMVVRCFDGSYLPGGEFNQAAAWHAELFQATGEPEASTGLAGLAGRSLLFMAVLSNAYSAHYNAPKFYEELQDPESGGAAAGDRSKKLASFRDITCAAFGFSGLLFLVVTLTGLQTFGTSVQPLVLNNFASGDHLAFVARAGLCACVLFEFPLLERCFRLTAVEMLGLPADAAKHPLAAAASVALAAALACTPGLGLDKVSAIGGALGASLLIYVAPALMALQLREKEAGPGSVAEAPMAFRAGVRPVEVLALRGVAGFGAMLGGLGVAEASGFGI